MAYTEDDRYEGESLSRSELLEQAPAGAVDFFQRIEGRMAEMKGKAWADAHPGVIAQLVVAATLDFNQAMNRVRFQELEKRLEGIVAAINTSE